MHSNSTACSWQLTNNNVQEAKNKKCNLTPGSYSLNKLHSLIVTLAVIIFSCRNWIHLLECCSQKQRIHEILWVGVVNINCMSWHGQCPQSCKLCSDLSNTLLSLTSVAVFTLNTINQHLVSCASSLHYFVTQL